MSDAGPPVVVPPTSGCADGTREGLVDAGAFQRVAACQGAFNVAGLRWSQSRTCDGGGGNAGANVSGQGCSAIDLCAPGWHICKNKEDFSTAGGDCKSAVAGLPEVFYASGQPVAGGAMCTANAGDVDGTNDLFGCGNGNVKAPSGSCTPPWNATLGDGCSGTNGLGSPPWSCTAGSDERSNAVKGPGVGGVLCCKD